MCQCAAEGWGEPKDTRESTLACLSVCLSVFLSVCRSMYLPAYLSVYVSVCLFVYMPVCLSACLSLAGMRDCDQERETARE